MMQVVSFSNDIVFRPAGTRLCTITPAPTSPIIRERVDDISVLLAQLERMDVLRLPDEHFSSHGNWVGLNLNQSA
jgi:hypothetical protein